MYDSKLNFVKNSWPKELYLHVTAAVFLGEGPNAPFAAIYEGRGGWHMSILYVFSSTGKLVYKEIKVTSKVLLSSSR
jgi:hypothetical protein